MDANILKPDRFWKVLTNVIFFFSKAKKSIIAIVMVSFFNADKENKNETKNRKAIWFEYIRIICVYIMEQKSKLLHT